MQLAALLVGIDGARITPPGRDGERGVDVTSLTHDSRRVESGALFACIPGDHTDGHDHAPAAVAAGAIALLVERPLRLGVPEVEVRSTRAVIGPIAASFYDHPSRSLRCVGVTGTNGKTTVCHLLDAIATAAGERPGLIGTTGARIVGVDVALEHTTPEAPELQALLAWMRDDGVTTVAMEVSSHALAQQRVDGTAFAAVCFTNLSHDHLDFHGDEATYFEAKARLFTDGFAEAAAVNVDDPRGLEIARRSAAAGLDVIEYSLSREGSAVHARDVVLDEAGARFSLVDDRAGERASVQMGLVGVHNVANALAAAATARATDVPFEAVVAGLSELRRVPGRLEPVDAGQDFAVLVDYAHTPDALVAAIDAARAVAPGGRVLVVVGCGGDRDRVKRPQMGAIASSAADVAIITSDNPRSEAAEAIAHEMLEGVAPSAHVSVELDRRAAIRAAIGEASPGDVVLIAGKGHETGQTTGTVTVPFDDRVVAREEILACS